MNLSEALNKLRDYAFRKRTPKRPTLKLIYPSKYPTPHINSYYGHERKTFTHEGVDIRAVLGTHIVACADGIVEKIYEGKYYGKCVVIRHNVGGEVYRTYYAHLSEFRTQLRRHVTAGELIGLAGSTGNSTGPHLHLTLQKDGDKTRLRGISLVGCIDPVPFGMDWPVDRDVVA